MQFKVGDFVVHPVHGMGDIVREAIKEIDSLLLTARSAETG